MIGANVEGVQKPVTVFADVFNGADYALTLRPVEDEWFTPQQALIMSVSDITRRQVGCLILVVVAINRTSPVAV